MENKIKECQPEKQRTGKKILIQEVEDEDDDIHDDTEQNGEIVWKPP